MASWFWMKQYNYCLDFLKGIACIFVVFMHCEFPGLMGTAVQAIGRFSVPFFFMVSGYFCFRPSLQQTAIQTGANEKDNWGIIRKKVMHIARITLYASLFYLAYVLLLQLLFHNQSFSISGKQLFNWVVFNTPRIIAGQYWFLFALLYAYILYGILERFHLRRFSYVLAAILFVVYVSIDIFIIEVKHSLLTSINFHCTTPIHYTYGSPFIHIKKGSLCSFASIIFFLSAISYFEEFTL